MAWWDSVEETRVLVAPASNPKGDREGRLLSLRHPKSGSSTCYFFIGGSLNEFHWFKQCYGSWFLGDYICEDGRLYAVTPVDPVFLLLPIFEEARMKKVDDKGKFRQLDEILFVDGFPAYQHLLPIAEDSMQVVCEIKEMGSSKFFRLDDSKVLAWLCCKVYQLKLTLPKLDKNYANQDGRYTLIDAVSLLVEYLKDEPWLTLVCSHLKLDLMEVTNRTQENEIIVAGLESTPGSSHPLQDQSGTDKKRSSGKQAKRGRVETGSRNIQDMLRKASRRGN